MRTIRLAAFVAIAATAVFWGTGSAQAGEVDNPSITLTLTPDTGPVGTDFVASGTCFEDGDAACDGVIVTLFDPDGNLVDGDDVFDNSDTYSFDLTIPADGPCGEYVVLAEGDENEDIIIDTTAIFDVPCPETTTTTEPPGSSSTTASVAATGATRPTFTG
jgi:hypothetical protein